jgi:hypothetical protein
MAVTGDGLSLSYGAWHNCARLVAGRTVTESKMRYVASLLAAAAIGAALSLALVSGTDRGTAGPHQVTLEKIASTAPAPAPGPSSLPTPGGDPLVPEGTHPGFYPSDGPAYGNSLAS